MDVWLPADLPDSIPVDAKVTQARDALKCALSGETGVARVEWTSDATNYLLCLSFRVGNVVQYGTGCLMLQCRDEDDEDDMKLSSCLCNVQESRNGEGTEKERS